MTVKVVEITPGRIIFRNPAGQKRLDTDDGLFHIVGDPIIGSRNIAAIGGVGSSTPLMNQTNDFVIATGRNPFCTEVIGAFYMGGSGSWGAAFSRWTTIMGGTLMWGLDAPTSGSPPILPSPTLGLAYEFSMSGTNVILRQHVRVRNSGFAHGFNAHSIAWNLETGLWT